MFSGAPQRARGHPEVKRRLVLRGRQAECEALERLLKAVRAGESRALAVCGEAGMGKTSLLEYLVERAPGCRVARAAGVQSEMELPFAGLHQLCAPMLGSLQRLPTPQRDALSTAFGLSVGPAGRARPAGRGCGRAAADLRDRRRALARSR